LLSVAESAARNTGSSIADVFRRVKSQNYLLGKLKKAFPKHDNEELREVIIATRWEILDDPSSHKVFERPRRPPVRGREPITSPKWDERIAQLKSKLLECPLETEE